MHWPAVAHASAGFDEAPVARYYEGMPMIYSLRSVGVLAASVLVPLGAVAQDDPGPDCSPIEAAVEARNAVGDDQESEAIRANISITQAIRTLRADNSADPLSVLCPDIAAAAEAYVGAAMTEGIVVTGTRIRRSAAPDSDDAEVPKDWRPFVFDGRTYYVVPLGPPVD
jgi:hypothetical protein